MNYQNHDQYIYINIIDSFQAEKPPKSIKNNNKLLTVSKTVERIPLSSRVAAQTRPAIPPPIMPTTGSDLTGEVNTTCSWLNDFLIIDLLEVPYEDLFLVLLFFPRGALVLPSMDCFLEGLTSAKMKGNGIGEGGRQGFLEKKGFEGLKLRAELRRARVMARVCIDRVEVSRKEWTSFELGLLE